MAVLHRIAATATDAPGLALYAERVKRGRRGNIRHVWRLQLGIMRSGITSSTKPGQLPVISLVPTVDELRQLRAKLRTFDLPGDHVYALVAELEQQIEEYNNERLRSRNAIR